jgi:hypothetical protein
VRRPPLRLHTFRKRAATECYRVKHTVLASHHSEVRVVRTAEEIWRKRQARESVVPDGAGQGVSEGHSSSPAALQGRYHGQRVHAGVAESVGRMVESMYDELTSGQAAATQLLPICYQMLPTGMGACSYLQERYGRHVDSNPRRLPCQSSSIQSPQQLEPPLGTAQTLGNACNATVRRIEEWIGAWPSIQELRTMSSHVVCCDRRRRFDPSVVAFRENEEKE